MANFIVLSLPISSPPPTTTSSHSNVTAVVTQKTHNHHVQRGGREEEEERSGEQRRGRDCVVVSEITKLPLPHQQWYRGCTQRVVYLSFS